METYPKWKLKSSKMAKKTTHLFEDNVYLISNHSVARNPMFSSIAMQKYFVEKMEKYLFPISEIISHSLLDNEFQILVRLRSREDFEEYFMSSHGDEIQQYEIPESTYIFSQAMANLQVSFVKHFNYTYERSGTLVAGRYERKLIETEMEMKNWIEKLNSGRKKHGFASQWVNDIMNTTVAFTSAWLYEGAVGIDGRVKTGFSGYLNGEINDLGDCFSTLPPYRLPSSKSFFLKQVFRIFRQNQSVLE